MAEVLPVERATRAEGTGPSRADVIAEAKGVSEAARANLVRAEQAAARDPRIGELPIEVYQAIIDSRAQTDKEFFESWAQSIAANAAADKRAHLNYEQAKAQETRVMHSAQLLVQQMRDAQRRGRLDNATIDTIHQQHGKLIIDLMGGRMPQVKPAPGAARPAPPARVTQAVPGSHDPTQRLPPPPPRGVQTR